MVNTSSHRKQQTEKVLEQIEMISILVVKNKK